MIYASLPNAYAPLYGLTNSMNTGKFSRRLSIKTRFENWIRESANQKPLKYESTVLNQWQPTTSKQDRTDKIDLFHKTSDLTLYGQSKFRQHNSGDDIGFAIVQPYTTLSDLKQCVTDEKLFSFHDTVAARDWLKPVDLYFCLDRTLQRLRIIHSDIVGERIRTLLSEWFASNEELNKYNKRFESPTYPGLSLLWTSDKGKKSYDSGVDKIMAYLPESIFAQDEMKVAPMLPPPDYMYAPVEGTPII